MGTSEMVGFERIWGESRTRMEGGAAPLPMFCGRRYGVAGAHIVLISPVKILIQEVIGGLLETA
jgi:hypothetical protein